MPNSDASEPPSTPTEQVEEPTVTAATPEHQRDLHQKKRRRSSGIPPMNFNNPADYTSSPYSGSSTADCDETAEQSFVQDDQDDDSSSDSDADGQSTMMSIDNGDEDTARSVGSVHSSTSSSGRLDAALQAAAAQAGTQGIGYDEHGDISMEMADDEVTAAFKPWVKKGVYKPQTVQKLGVLQDQENINPFSPAFKAVTNSAPQQAPLQQPEDNDDMSMDVTKAVGTILPAQQQSEALSARSPKRSINWRQSVDNASLQGDETMEFTTAFGGIQSSLPQDTNEEGDEDLEEDEDMSMELTAAVGSLTKAKPEHEQRRQSVNSAVDEDMDMTEAVGGILPVIDEGTETQDEETMGMEMTVAVGNILPSQRSTGNKSRTKAPAEIEVQPVKRRATDSTCQGSLSPVKSSGPTVASETGSPSRPNNRKTPNRPSTGRSPSTPQPASPSKPAWNHGLSDQRPTTPSKQATPKPAKPTTPSKTPPAKNVTYRSASPKKLFRAEIREAASTPRSAASNKIFMKDAETGVSNPSIILKPNGRRSSGLGLDREGLGSPRVAALLDRRTSIGEAAEAFTPQGVTSRGVRFGNPRVMELEADREREEDQRRESGRAILEQEVDGGDAEKDVTLNLREMIQSLTPKKNKLKGRKSLHVGAAKGLLGKRPVELDEDEDDEETPKRLKGREGSPVKSVRLPAPPTKTETIGRTTRSTAALQETNANITPSTISPVKAQAASTPKDQVRFRNTGPLSSPDKPAPSFEEKLDGSVLGARDPQIEGDDDWEPIPLQDFLNMTNVHFMELTTTKRRHTIAPGNGDDDTVRGIQRSGDANDDRTLEDCVTAGACTIPMIEMYSHVSITSSDHFFVPR